MKIHRIPRPVDGDECEQGWCKEGIANFFLSKYLFKMPRLVGGEFHFGRREAILERRKILKKKTLENRKRRNK